MFPPRYFAPRYFPPRYFPPGTAEVPYTINAISAMAAFQQEALVDAPDIYANWYVQPDVPGPFLTVKEFNS